MPERLDTRYMAAWVAFLRAHAELRERLEQELCSAGHPPLAWYDVLVTLAGAPDRRLRMRELASSVAFSRSGLTRLVDRMEAAGLVMREAVATDRRGSYCVLTDAGRATLKAAWPVHAAGIRRHFASKLSLTEAETIAAALGRIVTALRDQCDDGPAMLGNDDRGAVRAQ